MRCCARFFSLVGFFLTVTVTPQLWSFLLLQHSEQKFESRSNRHLIRHSEDLLAFAKGCDDSNLDASALASLPMTTWSANLRHVVEAGKDFVKAAIVPRPGAQPLPIRNYNCNQVTTWWQHIKAGTLYSAENLPTWCKLLPPQKIQCYRFKFIFVARRYLLLVLLFLYSYWGTGIDWDWRLRGI